MKNAREHRQQNAQRPVMFPSDGRADEQPKNADQDRAEQPQVVKMRRLISDKRSNPESAPAGISTIPSKTAELNVVDRDLLIVQLEALLKIRGVSVGVNGALAGLRTSIKIFTPVCSLVM